MAKIMIVDDSLALRFNLKNLLKTNGHDVIAEAANGEEACEKFAALAPDIITMDITMPKMDGITAIKQIRAKDQKTPIIMISALGQEIKVLEALKSGANDYIVKPFTPEAIVETIGNVVKGG